MTFRAAATVANSVDAASLVAIVAAVVPSLAVSDAAVAPSTTAFAVSAFCFVRQPLLI